MVSSRPVGVLESLILPLRQQLDIPICVDILMYIGCEMFWDVNHATTDKDEDGRLS